MRSKLPFFGMGVVAVMIAVATLLPRGSWIYSSVWFRLTWGAIAFSGSWIVIKKKLWRRPAVFLLHVSLLVILLGALITSLTGHRGMLHLRQGIPSSTYTLDDGNRAELPAMVRLDTFLVTFYPETYAPKGYESRVTFEKKQHSISMNRIGKLQGYRLYQSSFDPDGMGTFLSVNYDPYGTPVTYAGYVLLVAGLLGMLLTGTPRTFTLKPLGRAGTIKYACMALLVAHFIWRWLQEGHIPLTNTPETLHFVVICLFPFMPLSIALVTGIGTWLPAQATQHTPLMPVLRSPWLAIHVSTVMLAYALLVISFFRRHLLRWAVGLLAVGIFLGAVWANVSWGAYWSWDPKESWALITLLVYSIPLHTDSLPWFRSTRNYRIYSLLALATLLMTYFGVNYLLGGMHSYG